MARILEYSFRYFEQCNMCGSQSENHRILGRRLNTRHGLRPKKKIGIATTIMRCRKCGLIYANPIPIPKHIEQHYGVPPEDYWQDEYFTIDPDYLKSQIHRFELLYGASVQNANLTALDVGAGIGKAMVALSKAGFKVFGVEPSEPFYSRAISKTGVSVKQLTLTTIEHADFGESSFDFINMAAIVEHLYDPSSVIEKALTWLKPGGLIHVEVPSAAYLMSKLARLFYRLTGSDYVINTCPMHVPYHLYEFTPRSFQLHAKANHYSIAHYEYYVCESYMPKVVKPLFNLAMRISKTGMQLAIWLRKSPE